MDQSEKQWIKSVRNIFSSLNLGPQRELDSVPIELVQLINFLEDGIDLNDKGYFKEALAISQTIMNNFRYNIKNKGMSSYKRHNKNTQSPFPLYVAVKLYSSSWWKTLVNWLYFCAGIFLPYKSLLELARDIANRMVSQYNRNDTFLPQTLKRGIDNIDENSKSTTATRHYHRTIICFSDSNRREPWYSSRIWRSRKLIQPIIFENRCTSNFLHMR